MIIFFKTPLNKLITNQNYYNVKKLDFIAKNQLYLSGH